MKGIKRKLLTMAICLATATGAAANDYLITAYGATADTTRLSTEAIQKGGCQTVAAPSDEKEKEYPEATMWGPLPAKGFWLNHVKDIEIRNLKVTTELPDARPEIVENDRE